MECVDNILTGLGRRFHVLHQIIFGHIVKCFLRGNISLSYLVYFVAYQNYWNLFSGVVVDFLKPPVQRCKVLMFGDVEHKHGTTHVPIEHVGH